MKSIVFSVDTSCGRSGNLFQPSQFSAKHANFGKNCWQSTGLPSLRTADKRIRAENVTRRPTPYEGSDSWRKTDRGDSGVVEAPSIWDSNAENVRWRYGQRNSRPEEEGASSRYFRGRDRENEEDTDKESVEWDSQSRDGNSEWDYVSGEDNRGGKKASEGWKWWFDDNGDDTSEEEEEDFVEKEDDWLSWWRIDLEEVFMLLRWGVPAGLLLFSAVNTVIRGNPLIYLVGFSVFPNILRFFSPLVKDWFSSPEKVSESSSSTRTKKRRQPTSAYSRRNEGAARYTNYGSPSQSTSGSQDSEVSREKAASQRSTSAEVSRQKAASQTSSYAEVPRRKAASQTSSYAGWDDLNEDRSRMRDGIQWPLQRRAKSGRKLAKREKPLVVRLILAFFPFLRGFF